MFRNKIIRNQNFVHRLGNVVVTQVSNTAFMRMLDIGIGFKSIGINLSTHLLVSIPERHPTQHQLIDTFYTKHVFVFIVFYNTCFDDDVFKHIMGNIQTIIQVIESRKEIFFDQLQITVIT